MHVVEASPAYLPDEQTVHTVLGSESRSEYPVAQSIHPTELALVYEPADENRPGKHEVHGVEASSSWSSVPAAQVTHADDPCAAYCPEPHAMQYPFVPPTVSWYVPVVHSEHVSCPKNIAYVPTGQYSHPTDPTVS